MSFHIKTLLAVAYGVLAAIVTLMVFWSGSQYQKTEKLIAELNEAPTATQSRPTEGVTRRSLRPSLVRMQQLLEDRARLVREQEDQLRQQISGREELQQKFEKLSAAYEDLSNEHQLLLNEIEFFLGASNFATDWNFQSGGSTTYDGGTSPAERPLTEGQEPPDALASELENGNLDGNSETAIAELAALEVSQLQDEVARLNVASERDSLIAG